MMSDDEWYELWKSGGHSLLKSIQLIYATGYDDGQIDMVNKKILDEDFEEIKE